MRTYDLFTIGVFSKYYFSIRHYPEPTNGGALRYIISKRSLGHGRVAYDFGSFAFVFERLAT